MKELWLPLDQNKDSGVNVFISDDFYENEKCMMIIQGLGAVRAGMWVDFCFY